MPSAKQWDRVANLVKKVNPSAAERLDALFEQLSNLLVNVGVANDGTARAWAREEANKPIDHARSATHFTTIAKARNPLTHRSCIGESRKELAAAARRKWPERVPPDTGKVVRGASEHILSRCSSAEIRGLAQSLALYHGSHVQLGRQTKHRLDTLVEQLADIYATITRLEEPVDELPHEPGSRFIQFCHFVLEPLFDASESSPKAIGNRWMRLKDDAKRPAVPIKKLRPRKVRLVKRAARPTT